MPPTDSAVFGMNRAAQGRLAVDDEILVGFMAQQIQRQGSRPLLSEIVKWPVRGYPYVQFPDAATGQPLIVLPLIVIANSPFKSYHSPAAGSSHDAADSSCAG